MSERARVAAVTAAVLAVAAGAVAATWSATPLHGADWPVALVLAGLLAWSGRLQVHVRHRGSTEATDLFDVVLAVCAVAFAGPVLVPLALLAKGVSQALERVQPRKAVFNAAAAAASAGAMAVVLDVAAGLPLLGALALAQLAAWAVNHLALVAVLLAAGLREVVSRAALSRWASSGVVSGALALVLALAWTATPLAVVLFAAPLAAVHAAARSLVRARAERRRLGATAAASRVLASGTCSDLDAWLDHVRSAFGAPSAWLRTDGEPLVVGAPLPSSLRSWLDALPVVLGQDQPQRLDLVLPERVEVLAVRLPGQDGELAVLDPRGERESTATELATLAAAARELAAFLQSQRVRALVAQEHHRLDVVMRSVADAILTVGPDGTVQSCNDVAVGLLGSCTGQSFAALSLTTAAGPWTPPAEERVEGLRLRAPAEGAEQRHLDASSTPALVEGQRCLVVVLRDVTARVEQERARQRFVVGLGHELRTPLTPLLGWARTLRRHPELLDGPRRATVVDALETESERLARLVDNLLTAVDPGSTLTTGQEVDLLDLVQQRLRAAASLLRGRTVTTSAEGDTRVVTDPRAVGLVLDNLLSNVARYTPDGSPVRLRVTVTGSVAVVECADAGPGVADEQREAIFGLFVRGGDAEADPGVGMGLAVSRSLARAVGGDLVCAPRRPGDDVDGTTGAAFQLVLPVHLPVRRPGDAAVSALFSA